MTRIRITCIALALVLALMQAWHYRFMVESDGLSYIDIAAAYARGDWSLAINGFWSPLYSWLIGVALFVFHPSPYWESTVVEGVVVVAYMASIAAFDYYLRELCAVVRGRAAGVSGARVIMPDWAMVAVGYTLFMWSSLGLITLYNSHPDMCTVPFVYLASGLLLRMSRGKRSNRAYALLGLVLGLGYLAKAPMFPLGFIFLATALFSARTVTKTLPRAVLALGVFLLISAPFIAAISHQRGRLTFGDSGAWNYARYVDGVVAPVHWQGGPPADGQPTHPTRKLLDSPAVYEFGTPLRVTYPPFYDPAYWYDGVRAHLDLPQQVHVAAQNTRLLMQAALSVGSGFLIGLIILAIVDGELRTIAGNFCAQWYLIVPACSAFAMLALVHLEPRYIAPFLVIVALAAFGSVRIPAVRDGRRLLWAVTAVIVATVIPSLAYSASRWQGRPSTNEAWTVASALHRMGIEEGDSVAFVGNSYHFYWARLAGVRIIAELRSVQPGDVARFWASDSDAQNRVLATFARTGAVAIITDSAFGGATATGWHRVGQTSYYAYPLGSVTPHPIGPTGL